MMLQQKITKSIENNSKEKLSIQFSLDGFSFCILNSADVIHHFSSYSFDEEGMTPESLLSHIEDIFKNDDDLHHDFSSVLVVHQNHLNTFVPNTYFHEDQLKNYLNYNIKTISTDLIVYDDVDLMDAKNVYVPYVNINNFLFQNFGEFEFKHHTSILIEKLMHKAPESGKQCFVNVLDQSFDMLVFEDQKLQYINSFEFDTKEDFIYYILFAFEQLKLDTNEMSIELLGNIDQQSDLYEITYKYIRHVHFNITTSFGTASNELKGHNHFILLG